jgi:hypothetical protein
MKHPITYCNIQPSSNDDDDDDEEKGLCPAQQFPLLHHVLRKGASGGRRFISGDTQCKSGVFADASHLIDEERRVESACCNKLKETW